MSDEWQPRLVGPPRLVWPVPVDPLGLSGPTRGQAAGPGWRRSSKDRHVPAAVDGAVPEQRIVEAFARSADEGVVTGWASLRLHRASYFDGRGPDAVTRLPVLLLVGSARLRNTPEVVAIRARPAAPDVVTRHGIRCTRPERALLDHIAQVRDLRESVVAIDMAAAAELTSIRRFAAHLDLRDEMDALAERPREWHLRHATGPRWPASGVIRRASGDGRNNRRGPGLVWQMLQS